MVQRKPSKPDKDLLGAPFFIDLLTFLYLGPLSLSLIGSTGVFLCICRFVIGYIIGLFFGGQAKHFGYPLAGLACM